MDCWSPTQCCSGHPDVRDVCVSPVDRYIGFIRQIRHWIDNGWQGVLHLTSPGKSN